MTGTTTGHLDLDALADAVVGEADGTATTHLDGCPSCASRLRELETAEERVVAVLSTLPPPAVPVDLADRLSAALAAQAPLDPTAQSTGVNVTALPARHASRRPSWLPAAAAAVLLASGAGLGWSVLAGGTGSDEADSTAGRELLASESGTDYADPASLAGNLPAVLAGTGAAGAATSRTEAQGSAEAGGAAGTAGGDAADAATSAQAPAAATMSLPDAFERLRTTDGLAACLAGLQADGEVLEPLALDYATYAGGPALAVLLPDPDPAKVAVFVVGPDCAQADPQLLHYVRVDRPE